MLLLKSYYIFNFIGVFCMHCPLLGMLTYKFIANTMYVNSKFSYSAISDKKVRFFSKIII